LKHQIKTGLLKPSAIITKAQNASGHKIQKWGADHKIRTPSFLIVQK
jgi:hypothetical protein